MNTMDPELKKSFQEYQTQVIESRNKIANIETFQLLTTNDVKVNDSILEQFTKDGDIESKYFFQPIGRMLVKKEGKEAHEFLIERREQFQQRLKQYQEVKEVCLNRVKESEKSLRELVQKYKTESSIENKDTKSSSESKATSSDKPTSEAGNDC